MKRLVAIVAAVGFASAGLIGGASSSQAADPDCGLAVSYGAWLKTYDSDGQFYYYERYISWRYYSCYGTTKKAINRNLLSDPKFTILKGQVKTYGWYEKQAWPHIGRYDGTYTWS